ncbi:MAG: ABC transporter permease [Bacteroidales bacterium]|nr:ABC transporter permease [Bacteroidales bacterium]
MFKHYFSTAVRNLLRNKFQTLFSIVGLAVAFFCFGICTYFIYGFLSMDTYYKNHDRVLMLKADHRVSGTRPQWIRTMQEQCPEVESVFRFYEESNNYKHDELGDNINMVVITCDTTLRHIYNPRLRAGSWQAAEHSPNSMLLTESYARKFFGTPEQAIGQQFVYRTGFHYQEENINNTYTVQAVVEDLPFNNSLLTFCDLAAWVFNDVDVPWLNGSDDGMLFEPRILLRKGVDPDAFIRLLDEQK